MSVKNEDIQYVYDLINKEFEKKNNKINSDCLFICDYFFSIEEVDGVKCMCYIRYVNKENYEYDVDGTNNLYMFFIDNKNDGYAGDMSNIMYKYKNISLMNVVEHIFDVIPNLRLTIEGELSTKPEENKLIDIFKNIPNIKLCYEQCCVCTNYTKTKTRCKHSLCYHCWTKLPIKCNDEDYYQECPICRGNMPYF